MAIGRRTEETVFQAFTDFYQRTDGQLPALFTTDEYAAYVAAIVDTYSVSKEDLELTAEQKVEFNWENLPPRYFPVEIGYATVHKKREKGRVVRVEKRIRLGTKQQVDEALAAGSTAATINTSYVERLHGTQRHFNARKARKVYTFSKGVAVSCGRDLAVCGLLQLWVDAPHSCENKSKRNRLGITIGHRRW